MAGFEAEGHLDVSKKLITVAFRICVERFGHSPAQETKAHQQSQWPHSRKQQNKGIADRNVPFHESSVSVYGIYKDYN